MANTNPNYSRNLIPFKPGQSGNPGGKPAAARNRLTGKFLNALADDFDTHGVATIERLRQKNPAAYIKIVARLCPVQFESNSDQLEAFDNETLRVIAMLAQAYVQHRAAKLATEAEQPASQELCE